MFRKTGLPASVVLCFLLALTLSACGSEEPVTEDMADGTWVPADSAKAAWGDMKTVDEIFLRRDDDGKTYYLRIVSVLEPGVNDEGREVMRRTGIMNSLTVASFDAEKRVLAMDDGWQITFTSPDKIKLSVNDREINLVRKPAE